MIDLESVKLYTIKALENIISLCEKNKIETIDKKKGNDIVTNMDNLIEQELIKGLKEKYPSHYFSSEEIGEANIGKESTEIYEWVIDPIDGTINYAAKLPLYSTSISLKYNNEVVFGIIYNHSTKDTYSAIIGKGAYCNDKQIKVSNKENLEDSILSFMLTSHYGEKQTDDILNIVKKLSLKTRGLRLFVSQAIELTMIAEGKLDGTVCIKSRGFSSSAGALLVKEAGGTVTDINGVERGTNPTSLLVSNGLIHKSIIDTIKDSGNIIYIENDNKISSEAGLKDRYIGIDISKSMTAIGVFSKEMNIINMIRFKTPQNAENIIQTLIEKLKLILSTEKTNINSIGISVFGVVDSKKGIIIESRVVEDWKNIELVKIIEEKFKITTYIENDVRACAINEIGVNNEGVNTYIKLGSSMSVGTSLVNGEMLYGNKKSTGAITYFRDLYNDYILDDYIAEKGILKRIMKLKDKEVSLEQFFEMLENKDLDAINVYNETIFNVISLLNLVNVILCPKTIVLGGGLIAKYEQLFNDIKTEYIKSVETESPKIPKAELIQSKYGENSAMIGAAKLCINRNNLH